MTISSPNDQTHELPGGGYKTKKGLTMNVITDRPRRQMHANGQAIGFALAAVMGASVPAYGAIENQAVASGTYNSGTVNSTPDAESVPVVPLSRGLTIAKSVHTGASVTSGSDNTITDAGDTIVYRYTVTNTGNATETSISVTDTGPTFDGENAAGTLGPIAELSGVGTGSAATLAPGQTVVFEATYTLATLDILNAAGDTGGVSNIASATSTGVTTPITSPPATTTIPANPGLTIVKAATLNDQTNADNLAEAGETITYTYTVTNTGNVAITNVGIQDMHEGVLLSPAPGNETITSNGPLAISADAIANDGVIDTFGPGAVATFTYEHTVTQTEVDNQ